MLQEIYDYTFRQLELSIREIGYGDQSINKKMKTYLNEFYGIIGRINDWESLSLAKKESILAEFLHINSDTTYLAEYFDKFRENLLNNTLNSYIKGVIKLKI